MEPNRNGLNLTCAIVFHCNAGNVVSMQRDNTMETDYYIQWQLWVGSECTRPGRECKSLRITGQQFSHAVLTSNMLCMQHEPTVYKPCKNCSKTQLKTLPKFLKTSKESQ